MKTFSAPEELDILPDGAVIMLSTQNPQYGVAAQKDAGLLWWALTRTPASRGAKWPLTHHDMA